MQRFDIRAVNDFTSIERNLNGGVINEEYKLNHSELPHNNIFTEETRISNPAWKLKRFRTKSSNTKTS